MATTITTKEGIELTPDEAEIYCALKCDSDATKDIQRDVAAKLADLYNEGRRDVISNEAKANQFLAYSTESGLPTTGYVTAENTFFWLNWFTSFRLAFVRANRVADFFKKAFLPALFSIGGLSYFINVVIDLYQSIHKALYPRSQLERDLGFWRRFYNALNEGDRPNRMTNDLLWFGVNFAAFILSLGVSGLAMATVKLISAVANLAGFSLDVTHDSGFAWLNYKRHVRLRDKLMERSEKLNKEIQQLSKNINQLGDAGQVLRTQKIEEHKRLRATIERVDQKVKVERTNFIRTMVITVGIVVGMGLIFFPPTSLAGAVLIGSCLALGFGSVFGGLGRRLWLLTQRAFSSLTNMTMAKPKDNSLTLDVSNSRTSSLDSPSPVSSHSSPDSSPKSVGSTASTLSLLSPEFVTPPSSVSPEIDSTTELRPSPKFDASKEDKTSQIIDSSDHTARKMTLMLSKNMTMLIGFLERLEQTPADTVVKKLNLFTVAEIQRMRQVLGFDSQTAWHKQLNFWLRFDADPNTSSNGQRYRSSFKDALIERLQEERNLATWSGCKNDALPAMTLFEREFNAKVEQQSRPVRAMV